MARPTQSEEHARIAARLRTAIDLCAAGIAMMRQNLRRRHPAPTDHEIEEELVKWLRHRPGAEHGDSCGRPVSLTTRDL